MSADDASETTRTRRARTCEECGQPYFVDKLLEDNPEYFPPPYDYESGVDRYCLACWLGVGPGDTARDDDDPDEITPDEIR